MKPSVARLVHYVCADGECAAAMVTAVHEATTVYDQDTNEPTTGDYVSLTIFRPEMQAFSRFVGQDEGKRLGTWHWPERVM